MSKTAEALAVEVQRAKDLQISGRQFEALCSLIRNDPDPERRARALCLMRSKDVLDLIGEQRV